MILKQFILLYIAHLLGDIIFASYRLAILKRDSRLSRKFLGISLHGLVHCLFAGLILFWGGCPWLKGAVLVFIIHSAIDWIRCIIETRKHGYGRVQVRQSQFVAWLKNREENKGNVKASWFFMNIADQTAHILSLIFIANIL